MKTNIKLSKKLVFKIPMQILIATAIVMTIICITLGVLVSGEITNYGKKQIQLLADVNANKAESYFENMNSKGASLSQELVRYRTLETSQIDKMIRSSLETLLKDKRIFSSYAAFEPNSYIADTPNGISYYAFNDSDTIKFDVLNNYDKYNKGEYYAVTKETNKAHISQPYEYTLSTGKKVWLITISNPVFNANGRFIGVVNCDIETETINHLEYNLGGFKTAYSYILTDKSTYVSNTKNQELAGTNYSGKGKTADYIKKALSSGASAIFNKTVLINEKNAFEVHVPLTINGIEQKWSSSFAVSKYDILKQAKNIILIVALISALGVILIAAGITYLLVKSLKPIKSIVEMALNVGNGNLSTNINVKTDDELGELARIFKNTADKLSGYIHEISYVLGEISSGNLDVTVEHDYEGEFAPIKNSMENIINSLSETMQEIKNSSDQVSSGAEQVSSGAQLLSQGATEQASSIEELSATINEISDQVKQNAQKAIDATNITKESGYTVNQGNEQMHAMIKAMNEINETSTKISQIIKTIDDIAFQTNILALNAAVEAARAGSAGKGFAVVASEVRNLASKSADAAKTTTELIETSIQAVKNGRRIADATAVSLSTIVKQASKSGELIESISVESNNQASSIVQVTQGIEQVSAVIQTNSATAEESAAASEELSAQAQVLKNLVSKFNFKSDSSNTDYNEFL